MTVQVTSEPKTYERHSSHGWLSDICKRSLGLDPEADDRLRRHAREMELEKRTSPNLGAGTGGEFAPPTWLTELYSGANRATRPLADLVPWLPMPAGAMAGQTINIPNLSVGPSTSPTRSASDVSSTDATTTSNQARVQIISGDMAVSQQLFDLTPGAFDELMWAELLKSYDETLEWQMVNGLDGTTNEQLRGLAWAITQVNPGNVIAGGGVTTPQAFNLALAQAASNVSNRRKLAPQIFILAGRRWFWYGGQSDTANRPISTPGMGLNVELAQQTIKDSGAAPVVGPLLGLPAYLDGAITAGSNTDNAYAARPADMLLFEGPQYVMATPEPLSGTLSVRLSYHRSAAFFPLRKADSLGAVTAMPAPSGF